MWTVLGLFSVCLFLFKQNRLGGVLRLGKHMCAVDSFPGFGLVQESKQTKLCKRRHGLQVHVGLAVNAASCYRDPQLLPGHRSSLATTTRAADEATVRQVTALSSGSCQSPLCALQPGWLPRTSASSAEKGTPNTPQSSCEKSRKQANLRQTDL